MAEQKKAQYAKPASQVDLEERLENGNQSDKVLSTADSYEGAADEGGRDFAVEGNDLDGYVGVSPEYQNYANETEAPVEADDSAENKVIAEFAEGQEALQKGKKSTDERKEEAAQKAASAPAKKSTSSSTSSN